MAAVTIPNAGKYDLLVDVGFLVDVLDAIEHTLYRVVKHKAVNQKADVHQQVVFACVGDGDCGH